MRWLYSPGKFPLFSEIGLLLLLAWVVSGWLLPADRMLSSGQVSHAAVADVSLPDLNELLAVPLFGEAPAKAEPVKPAPQPVVRTPLTIKLLGTVVAGEDSSAVIALAANGEQKVFHIGDIIQPGVTLHSVEPWAVVVDHAGTLERITMEKDAIATPVAAPAQPTRPLALARPAGVAAGVKQLQMNQTLVQQQLNDLPTLLSQARVVPNYNDGKPDGFVISEIVPGSLYEQAGLQNGDVILSVNGRRVSSAEQAMGLYQELQSATAVDLELMRAGQMRQLHYNFH